MKIALKNGFQSNQNQMKKHMTLDTVVTEKEVSLNTFLML